MTTDALPTRADRRGTWWSPRGRGLRTRLQIITAVVAVAVLALALIRAKDRLSAEQARLGARAQDNANYAGQAFDATVRDARTLLSVLAFGSSRMNDRTRSPIFKALGQSTELPFSALYTVDRHGAVLAATRDSATAIVPPGCIDKAAARNAFTVCPPYKRDRNSAEPWMLVFVQPAVTASTPDQFVAASIAIDSLEPVRLARRLPPGSVLTMLDSSGIVMLRTLEANGWIGRLFPDFPLRDKALAPLGSDTVVNSEIDRRNRLFGSTSAIETGWRVYIGIPVEEAFGPSTRQFVSDIIMAAVVCLVVLLLGYWTSARIVGPIESLTTDARAISDGDMTRRSLVEGDDEVGTLARTFNQMADAIVERTSALETSQEQLRQSQKLEALGGFAGGIAHEFNNYLSSIIGHSELAIAQAHDDVVVRAELGGLLTSAKRAADLTRQVLVFSRRQVVMARLVEVAPAIHEVARLLERLLGERIALRVKVDEGLGPVFIDPGQLEQVLMNLAANARDAMPAGGAVTITVTRASANDRERLSLGASSYIRFSVSDTGPGVPVEVRARLFEPFFTTKAREHGTGLGLSISYGIMQSARGAIEVDQTTTSGATFHFYLPEQGAAEATASVVTPSVAPSAVPAGGSERLLLVEDDASVAEVARRLLKRAGYDVTVMRDAESALDTLAVQSFDLLLSDVVMPGMSGAALAQVVRQRYPSLRVVLMSGYPDDDLVANEIAQHHVAFLAKPFSQSTLLSAVRDMLDNDPLPLS